MTLLETAAASTVVVGGANAGRMRMLPQFQILWTVVGSLAIDVMHAFVARERTAQFVGHDKTVLRHVLVLRGHHVTGPVHLDVAITSVATVVSTTLSRCLDLCGARSVAVQEEPMLTNRVRPVIALGNLRRLSASASTNTARVWVTASILSLRNELAADIARFLRAVGHPFQIYQVLEVA